MDKAFIIKSLELASGLDSATNAMSATAYPVSS